MNYEEYRGEQLKCLWGDLANGAVADALRNFRDGMHSVRRGELLEMHYGWVEGKTPDSGVMFFAIRESMDDDGVYAWGAVRAEGGWLIGLPTSVNELTVKVLRFIETPEHVPSSMIKLGNCLP